MTGMELGWHWYGTGTTLAWNWDYLVWNWDDSSMEPTVWSVYIRRHTPVDNNKNVQLVETSGKWNRNPLNHPNVQFDRFKEIGSIELALS